MAEASRDPPPEPVFLDADTALARIQAIVGNARTIWFTLIGFLAFIGLTLVSVRDLDFFSLEATTQLPIVGIAIPTTTLFWSAAWLAAILHTYFNLYLVKLWDVLAEAPPEIGGVPLGDRIFPWVVLDWALRQRPDRPVTGRPMDWLASAVTYLVVWLGTPLVLAAVWWRSMPAHDARLTLVIGTALFLSYFATLRGWYRSQVRLTAPGRGDTGPFWRHSSLTARLVHDLGAVGLLLHWLQVLVAVPVIVLFSLAGAGWHHLPTIVQSYAEAAWPDSWRAPPLLSANLVGAEIARRPADWVGRDTAERRFKFGWCRDRQIPADACESPTEHYQAAARGAWCGERAIEDCATAFRRLEAAFDMEWREQRREYLANLAKPALVGRDLRGANATGAFLVGVDLREARLEGANLHEAQLEGANLYEAQLEGANLFLSGLEETNLQAAQLNGANLINAQLRGANLMVARLDGAKLYMARLQGTDWRGATFTTSPAHSADFAGGRNLTQNQLAQVIGDRFTILPRDAETGEQLYVWTCWTEPPPNLERLLAMLWWEDPEALRAQWLCPPGVAPERTGRPADPAPAAPNAD